MESGIFYLTKYALTKGIIAVEAKVTKFDPNEIEVIRGQYREYRYKKPDWFLTENEALERAKVMLKNEENRLHKHEKNLLNIKIIRL